jgi:excisionase family DNA binding protein
VRRLIGSGALKAYKVGKEWRVPVGEVERYLRSVSNTAAQS